MNTYKFTACAKCPKAEMLDFYECVFTSDEMVECETISTLVLELSARTLFQEQLAFELSKSLGGSVHVSGIHSGIKVTSIS